MKRFHQEKLEQILKLIGEIYSDKRIPASETAEILESIIEHLEPMINALETSPEE